MKEEIIGGFGGYMYSISFQYTLIFTSNRIIAAEPKTRQVEDWLNGLVALVDHFTYWERLKSHPLEDILKESRWNFTVPYKEIEKVEIKKERKLFGIGLLIDMKLKKESETKVLTYAKFGRIPWKRPKLLPASQISMPITFKASVSFDKEESLLNLFRSVLGDRLVVSEPKLPVEKENLMAKRSRLLQEYSEELVKKYFTKYPHNPGGSSEVPYIEKDERR